MKRFMVWIFGLMAMLATTLAFANATAFSVSGNVTAQTGAASPRLVRQGDTVRAGDTVITGANSSAVLKFEDGQIAALGANSRMLIQTFEYNAQAKTGNIVLSLLRGGMRAITGLIGQSNPQKVTYKAGNYTIGIRGTDTTIAVDGIQVVVTVETGTISFTVGNQVFTINAGEGAFVGPDGSVRTGNIATVVQAIANNPALQSLLQGAGTVVIPAALLGLSGTPGQAATITSTPTQQTGAGSGGGSGGGGPGQSAR